MAANEKQIKKTYPIAQEPANNDASHLINQAIVQILVERNNPEEIKDLMRAELDYNKERLSIIREHAEKHPDAIEERKTKRFRRTQYLFLMVFLSVLLPSIALANTTAAIPLSAIAMIVVSGVVLNGRDRDSDSETIVKIIEKISKRPT